MERARDLNSIIEGSGSRAGVCSGVVGLGLVESFAEVDKSCLGWERGYLLVLLRDDWVANGMDGGC